MRFESDPAPGLGEMSLRRVAQLVEAVRTVDPGGTRIVHASGERFDTYRSYDYDGHPLEDMVDLRCYDRSARQPRWKVTIVYEATEGDTYDYVANASVDRTTAYKSGGPKTYNEVKFKLRHCLGGEACVPRLLAIEPTYLRLAKCFQSPAAWAESGIAMAVTCRKCHPQQERLISSQDLVRRAAGVADLPSLRRALVCKSCGTREPWLSIPAGTPADG